LVVSEKRVPATDIIKEWKVKLNERIPNLPVYELILYHQISQAVFYPLHWLIIQSGMSPEEKQKTFIHFGPCGAFKEEIHCTNPYIPYIYLIDSQRRVRWLTSANPTKQELDQLADVIFRAQKTFTPFSQTK
jgi:hypothetical protein